VTIDDAIRDLLDVSTDIRSVAVVDGSGVVVAAGPGDAPADSAAAVSQLWDAAARYAGQLGDAGLEHVVVPVTGGSVAIVSAHGHQAAAVTGPQPAVALLLFDLRTCLGDAFGAEDTGR
jgi:predicted regulator of Ras-like GTPase activity (Roadblock/LC7/MglB family)